MPLSSPFPCPPQCYGDMNQLPGSGFLTKGSPWSGQKLAWPEDSALSAAPTPSATHRAAEERGFLQAEISI